jgi:[acyl-carrier-protein] S-malonyltransferase
VLSAGDAFAAVRERGRLMQREADKHKGAMAAIIGLDPDKLADLMGFLIESGSFALANFNTPEQTVVSGTPELVAKAGELAKAAGARAVPLKVSGAWHSPLMAGATQDFTDFLAARTFHAPKTAIYLNATALPAEDAGGIRQAMSRQLTSPVRFCDLILNMKAAGVDTWVEVGPKNVLKGIVRKILPDEPAERFHNVQDQPTLAAFMEALKV